MKIGVDNAIIWVRIAAKSALEQPGSSDSAILRMMGIIEHRTQRGTVVTTEQVHIPLEARGRAACALNSLTKIGTGLWIMGEHHEDQYLDRYGEEQHKLKILVQSFEVKKEIDLKEVFG